MSAFSPREDGIMTFLEAVVAIRMGEDDWEERERRSGSCGVCKFVAAGAPAAAKREPRTERPPFSTYRVVLAVWSVPGAGKAPVAAEQLGMVSVLAARLPRTGAMSTPALGARRTIADRARTLATACMRFLGDKPASGQPRATAFVLTDEARTQKYGCAVELPSASGRREDRVAVCCVGRLPLFRQLHATLRYVLGGAACSAEEAARAAHFAVFGVPLPPRGLGAVQLTLGDASWALSRPPLNAHPFLFDDWTLSLPGRLLSPRGCVRLLRALAAESKVVVVAPASHAPALLAPFCTAALAQLWPLRWEHALIPALPDTLPLRSVLEAPCPIFIGASRERLDAVAALGPLPSDVVVVDIGAGTVAPGKRAMASLLPIPADAERELAAVIARLRPHDGTAAAGRGGPAAAAAAEVAAAAAEALQPPDRGQVAGGCGPRSSRLLAASAAVWVPLLRAIDDAFCLRHEAEAAEAARAAAAAAAAAGASPARDAAPGGGRSGPSFGPELLGGAHVVLDVGTARAAVKRNSALSAMLEALLQTQALACYCDRRGSVDTDDEMDVRRVAHASPEGADAARALAMRALLRAMACTSAAQSNGMHQRCSEQWDAPALLRAMGCICLRFLDALLDADSTADRLLADPRYAPLQTFIAEAPECGPRSAASGLPPVPIGPQLAAVADALATLTLRVPPLPDLLATERAFADERRASDERREVSSGADRQLVLRARASAQPARRAALAIARRGVPPSSLMRSLAPAEAAKHRAERRQSSKQRRHRLSAGVRAVGPDAAAVAAAASPAPKPAGAASWMSSVLSRALGRRKPAPVGGTWPPRAPLTARKRRRMVRERVQRLIDEQERAAQSRLVRALAMSGLTAVAVTSAGALLASAGSAISGEEEEDGDEEAEGGEGFRASKDGSAGAGPRAGAAAADRDPDLETLNVVLRPAGLRAERGAGCSCHRCGEDSTYTAAARAVARASRADPGKRASDPGAPTTGAGGSGSGGGGGGGGGGVRYSVPCASCGSQMVPRLCVVPASAAAADTADGVWVEVLGPAAIAREIRGVVAHEGAAHGHLHRLREERANLFWSTCFSLVRAVAAGRPGEPAALACGFVTDPPDDSWLASEAELEAAAEAVASAGGHAGSKADDGDDPDDEDAPAALQQLTSPGGTALPGTVLLLPGYAAAMLTGAVAAVSAAARSPRPASAAASEAGARAGALVPRWSVGGAAGPGAGRDSTCSSARLPSLDRVGSEGPSSLRRAGSMQGGRLSIARPSPGRRLSRARSRASLGSSSTGSALRPLSIPSSSADRRSRRPSAMADGMASPIVASAAEPAGASRAPVPRAAAMAAAALAADVQTLRQQHVLFVQTIQREAARAVKQAAARGAASVALYRAEAMVAKAELLRSRARVRVVVRVRPPRAGWAAAGGGAGEAEAEAEMAIAMPGSSREGGGSGPSASGVETAHVWDEAEPAVAHALQGGVGCVLAYGQTGSGKTHTMGLEGGAARLAAGSGAAAGAEGEFSARAGRGVVPRALAMALADARVQSGEMVVRVNAVEVHNDAVIDLLRDGLGSAAAAGSAAGRGKHHAHHHQRSGSSSVEGKIVPRRRDGAVELPGAVAVAVTCEADGARLLATVAARRATSSTSMNASSSRSHCVVVLGLYRSRQSTDSTNTAGATSVSSGALSQAIEDEVDAGRLLPEGKLVLADLAGSERLKRTGAMDDASTPAASAASGPMGKQEAADRAKEAGAINKSLSALGNVMQALAKGDEARKAGGAAGAGQGGGYVPWRDSLLTTVLSDAVGPGAATVLLAAVAPDAADAPETLRTLQFAERARAVRAAGSAGAGPGASAKLKRRLKKTSDQLTEAKARISALEDRLRRAEAAAAASGAKAAAAEAQVAAAAAAAARAASSSAQPSGGASGAGGGSRHGMVVAGEVGSEAGSRQARARAATSSSMESDVSASALGCPPSPIRVLDAAIAGAHASRPRRIASSPSLLDGRSPAGRLAATFLQRHQAALASPNTSAYALARMALWRGTDTAALAETAALTGTRAASPPRVPAPVPVPVPVHVHVPAHSRQGVAGGGSEARTPVRRARRAAAGATRGAATPGSAIRSRYDMHGRRIKAEPTGFPAAPRAGKPRHVRTKSSSGSVGSDVPASPKAVPLSPTGRANAGGFRA
ncbi:KIN4A [Symbiodinium sp. KB8]|nr:KIN4A [Symbiodinium sp. KB8]